MIKKIITIAGCLLLIACGLTQGLMRSAPESGDSDNAPQFSIKTTRSIPPTADFGKYLAGAVAKNNQDMIALNTYYRDVLAADPENTLVLEQLYLTDVLLGRFDDLLSLIPKMDEQMQDRLYAKDALVVDALRQGYYQTALKQLKQVPDSALQDILTPILAAWIYVGQNESEKALNALKPLYKNDQLKALGLYNEMMIRLYFNQTTAAENVAQVLVKMEQPTIPVLLGMKELYQRLNKWNPSNPIYTHYVQLVEKNEIMRDLLKQNPSAVQLDTPQKGAAQIFYDIAASIGGNEMGAETAILFNAFGLALNPDSYMSRLLQAELLESLKLYEAANQVYDAIPNPPDMILFKKAVNLIYLNDLAAAEPILTQLSRDNLGNPLIHGMLAGLYRDTNRPEQAIVYYSLSIDLLKQIQEPKTLANIYFMRASAYEQMKKMDLAESDLIRSLALDSDNPTVLNYLGYAWLEQGKNLPKAIEYIQKAHVLAPNEPHILDSLAWAYYKQKDYQKALELAEQVSDLLPGSSVAADHLGDIYRALGRYREAGYQYKKALDLASDLKPQEVLMLRKKQKDLNKTLKNQSVVK